MQISLFDYFERKKLKVLVACEESQRVCIAFRDLGHEAYSCDIQECSGGHPEWHIKGDVLSILNGYCEFKTQMGDKHLIESKWDLIIAHPPCTYLCLSGQQWCNIELYGDKAKERLKNRDFAVWFFMQFVNADCEKIAIENPVGVMTRYYKKADQYVCPYQFGHPTGKRTGLWLKGLPKLKPTNIVNIEYHISSTGRKWDKWFWESSKINPLSERSKFRSKTFEGIARAMAEQWGGKVKDI
jgi:hypothetical protein